MATFQFRLETLLDLRRRRRDECRRVLAEVRRQEAELAAAGERVVQQRVSQLQELRNLNSADELNVDATSARRYYAGQLTVEIANISRQRKLLEGQIDVCRHALDKADQDVKACEHLRDKQQTQFLKAQEQRAQRELEESWSAAHRDEVNTC